MNAAALLVVLGLVALRAAATPAAAEVQAANLLQTKHFVFVGGLQRSGTTLLGSLLGELRDVSMQSVDNIDASTYAMLKPWDLHNFTQKAFEGVVRTGGIEGKFVQTVYPYLYILADLAPGNRGLSDIAFDEHRSFVTTANGLLLTAQWAHWWNLSAPVLVEKTPENVIMSRAIQSLIGPTRTRFLFSMRHPLVWSLAVEKWTEKRCGRKRLGMLCSVKSRVSLWLQVAERLEADLEKLEKAVVVYVELLSEASYWPSVLRALGLPNYKKPSLTSEAQPHDHLAMIRSDVLYVTCWLGGKAYLSKHHRCDVRSERANYFRRTPSYRLAEQRKVEFHRMLLEFECTVNAFGYSFWAFEHLVQLAPTDDGSEGKHSRLRLVEELQEAQNLDIASSGLALRYLNKPHMLGAAVVPEGLHKGDHVVVLVPKLFSVQAKMGPLGGMNQRMHQVVAALRAQGCILHLLCTDCNVTQTTDSAWMPANVNIHRTGSPQRQIDRMLSRDRCMGQKIRLVVSFFTQPTMKVTQAMAKDPNRKPPPLTEPLSTESVTHFLHKRIKQLTHTKDIEYKRWVITDDVHHVRVKSVLAELGSTREQMELGAQYLKYREVMVYRNSDVVLTVSEEDSDTIARLLDSDPSPRKPQIHWLKFIASVPFSPSWPQLSAVPFHSRSGMLFIGNTHALAVACVRWMLSDVMPKINDLLESPESRSQSHFTIGGASWSKKLTQQQLDFTRRAGVDVTIATAPTDAELELMYSSHRVFLAPLFNGTGVATKVINAMAHGIPVVTTPQGTHGLFRNATTTPPVAVADNAADFARRVVELLLDSELARRMSEASVAFIDQHHSEAALEQTVRELLSLHDADSVPPRVVGRSLQEEQVAGAQAADLARRRETGNGLGRVEAWTAGGA